MRLRLLGILGLGLVGCSASNEVTSGSGSAHTEGALTWSNDPHGWADLDRPTYDAARPNEKTGPVSNPVSTRAQKWIDRYDNVAREIVRATGTELAAPHPYARIVVAPDLEPEIPTVPVCVAAASAPPKTLPAEEMSLAVMTAPKTIAAASAGASCVVARNWTTDSGLAWFNKLGGLKLASGTTEVTIKSATKVEGRAAKVAVRSAPSFINVNAGTVAALSEKGVAVAIAHQLAHYYRTHATTNAAGKYDFWFDRAAHTADRPKPVANQAEYADQYAKLKLPRFLVPGQKLNARLGSTLVGWLEDATLDPAHVCADAQATLKGFPAAVHDELTTGDAPLSFDARQAYLTFEGKLATCLDSAQLTDDPEPTDGSTMTFQGSSISRAWLTARIDDALKAEAPAPDVAATHTLRELTSVLDAAGKRLDDQAPDFLKHLADNNIGLYTAEQEADELAMDLATRIGLTTDEVIAGYIEVMYAAEKEDPALFVARHGMTAKACEDLAKTNFKDADHEVYVSMGGLDDPHHAFCYRLLNLQREREAHAYTPATPNFKPETVAWKDIQTAANELLHPGSTPKAPTKDPGTGTTTSPSGSPTSTGTSDTPAQQDPPISPPASQDTTSDEPAADPTSDDTTPTVKPKSSSGGCSTAPGSSGDYAWLVGVAAALAVARRRRS